jgi:hypothetical protein
MSNQLQLNLLPKARRAITLDNDDRVRIHDRNSGRQTCVHGVSFDEACASCDSETSATVQDNSYAK